MRGGDLAGERILLGSGAPFCSITPGLLKLEGMALSDTARQAVEQRVAWSRIGGRSNLSVSGTVLSSFCARPIQLRKT